METKAERPATGLALCLVMGAGAFILGTGLSAGPFAALAAAGACLFLLGLAAGMKVPVTPPKP